MANATTSLGSFRLPRFGRSYLVVKRRLAASGRFRKECHKRFALARTLASRLYSQREPMVLVRNQPALDSEHGTPRSFHGDGACETALSCIVGAIRKRSLAESPPEQPINENGTITLLRKTCAVCTAKYCSERSDNSAMVASPTAA